MNFWTKVTVLCQELDPTRLFIVADVDSVERADALIARAKDVCASKRRTAVQVHDSIRDWVKKMLIS